MTQYPVILAGMDPTASLLQALAPFMAYKSNDQSVTSSTTLANDNALSLPVAANGTYFFICMLKFEGGTSGSSDLKFAWTGPSGFGMNYQLTGLNAGGGSTLGFMRSATGSTGGTTGAGNVWGTTMLGTVTASSTAGTLQLQWAQNTSSATATIVHAGSVLAMWRIS